MTRFTWTPDAVASLCAMYPNHTSGHVAAALGCSTKAVQNKAREQGLHKSKAFFDSTRSGRIERGQSDPRMIATRFKAGFEPWNKGKPGTTGLHPNCRPTQFKSLPPNEHRNYVPIGSRRLNKDGLLERKVTDDRTVAPARRWKAEHRLVWEKANGPTPAGCIVVFRPGCRTAVLSEITLDRLECISRADNARRNHPVNVSPEFAKITQLKGAINRQINRIIRESQA